MHKFVLIFVIFFYLTEKSFAYLGPGLAFGMLAAIISFLGAILILIYGFFFKIFKIFKNRKSKKNS